MTFNVSRSRSASLVDPQPGPSRSGGTGEFNGRKVSGGGGEALKRSASAGDVGGAAVTSLFKRSLSGSTGPQEGSSTGAARRLPANGSEAARADGIQRTHILAVSRLQEKSGPDAALSKSLKSAHEVYGALDEMNPSSSGDHGDLSGLLGAYAKDASANAVVAKNLGHDDIASDFERLADSASKKAKWLASDNRAEDPATVSNILKAKSFTTDGAARVLRDHRQAFVHAGKAQAFDAAVAFLDARRTALGTSTDSTPLTKKGAQAFMGSEKTDGGLLKADKAAKASIRDALKGLDFSTPEAFRSLDLPLATKGIREDGVMTLFLEKMFDDAGIAPEGVKVTTGQKMKAAVNSAYHPLEAPLQKMLLAGRLKSINEGQQWNTVNTKVEFKAADGSSATLDVEIKPQSQFKSGFSDMNGGGVNCHMAKSYKHVTNLAVTSISHGGTTIFEGIRHGTLSAYKIKAGELKKMPEAELRQMIEDLHPRRPKEQVDADVAKIRKGGRSSGAGKVVSELRAAACERRAKDVIAAALVKDQAKLDDALQGRPVTVTLASLSLLTLARQESKMWDDQLKAWNAVGGEVSIDLALDDGSTRSVKVTVDVLPFNFGVNMGTLGGRDRSLTGGKAVKNTLVSPLAKLFGLTTWRRTGATNDASMDKLLGPKPGRESSAFGGLVGAWIAKSDADAAKETDVQKKRALEAQIRNVKILAQELVKVYDTDESYKSSDSEPYQAQRLIGSLMNRMGQDVAWNCKSGKDRTGQLDVFLKRDAAREAVDGEVGGLDAERTDTDRDNMYEMAVNGGNHEMQALNTGAPGFKLGGHTKLTDLYGRGTDTPEWKAITGGSPFFGS